MRSRANLSFGLELQKTLKASISSSKSSDSGNITATTYEKTIPNPLIGVKVNQQPARVLPEIVYSDETAYDSSSNRMSNNSLESTVNMAYLAPPSLSTAISNQPVYAVYVAQEDGK